MMKAQARNRAMQYESTGNTRQDCARTVKRSYTMKFKVGVKPAQSLSQPPSLRTNPLGETECGACPKVDAASRAA